MMEDGNYLFRAVADQVYGDSEFSHRKSKTFFLKALKSLRLEKIWGGGDGEVPPAGVEMVNVSDKLENVVQEMELFETATREAMKRNLLSKEERHEACRPWRKALIVKLLGGGPWVISGHYLVMQRWQPEFFPFTGAHMKIDSCTMSMKSGNGDQLVERGKFARLCIEVDLRKRLVAKFQLNNRTCMSTPVNQSKPVSELSGGDSSEKGQTGEDAFGPWMLAGRQRHHQPNSSTRGSRSGSGIKLHDAVKGNVADPNGLRFDVLMEDCMEENQVEQEHVKTISSSVEEECIVSSKGPQKVKETTCHETQNMVVDGLKMGLG
ncbi:hypothetical protein SESBI_49955 [Sesbania bispinosa]|nr:hypothetical protein SESBI_49955 [Sesbania bispinosa]